MAESKDLVGLIKENAHFIEMEDQGKLVKAYFVIPGELYDRLQCLTWLELKPILRGLDGSLSLLNIEKDIVTQYDETGYNAIRYSQMKFENKIKVDELLGLRKGISIYT